MIVTVLIPVWNRPDRAAAVAATIAATSDARVLFVVADDDKDELKAVRKVQRTYNTGLLIVDGPSGQPGDYARKINRGVVAAGGDWFFQGADDLHFHTGWLTEALVTHERTGALVIGTNDLCNPRTARMHSTHSLVHRDFLDRAVFDRPGHMLHEGYWHNFVDDELLMSARLHRTYAHAHGSHVEHIHPNCGKVLRDPVYDRALDTRQFSRDRHQLRQRDRMMRRQRRPVLRRPTAPR